MYSPFYHSWASDSTSAEAAGIGIPASSISVRYRSIPVPDWDWGILILVPDSRAFQHLTKLNKDTSTESSSVRL
jgi:hypothetical protein